MDGIKQYFLSITAAALTCSVVKALIGKEKVQTSIATLLCGIFMAVTILSPILDLKIADIASYIDDNDWSINSAVDEGVHAAETGIRTIITEETCTYILDKAASLDAEIQVDVVLQEAEPVPSSVVITGDVSPYVRTVLSDYIEDTLGISEDAQIWK